MPEMPNMLKKWFTPIGRGGNLNCKLKTFGFMDTLKVHIQSNYLPTTTLSLLQTKLAEKPETKECREKKI